MVNVLLFLYLLCITFVGILFAHILRLYNLLDRLDICLVEYMKNTDEAIDNLEDIVLISKQAKPDGSNAIQLICKVCEHRYVGFDDKLTNCSQCGALN